jgi:gamma-glutamylcyclotransferase (GGCT)/AIG2-like uncharacterized protein YtfP
MEDLHEMVFVYGTLRRGASNHFRMTQARFVTEGAVLGRLYRVDWYPGVVADENAAPVMGEIFETDAPTIEALDEFEGNGYRRVMVPVKVTGEAGTSYVIEAWMWEWLGDPDEAKLIASGDWLAES